MHPAETLLSIPSCHTIPLVRAEIAYLPKSLSLQKTRGGKRANFVHCKLICDERPSSNNTAGRSLGMCTAKWEFIHPHMSASQHHKVDLSIYPTAIASLTINHKAFQLSMGCFFGCVLGVHPDTSASRHDKLLTLMLITEIVEGMAHTLIISSNLEESFNGIF